MRVRQKAINSSGVAVMPGRRMTSALTASPQRGCGTPITIGGVVYAKGLGTHADSSVEIYLGGQCTTFTTVLGLDDSKDEKGEGNVIYQVYGDGQLLHTSAPILWDNPGTPLTVDVTDVDDLRLVVGTNGVNYRDHANWADAKVTCAG